jgi:hypothetical protein
MNTPEQSADGGPSSALLTALTTEHYTLQSARATTVVEANGRSALFLSVVSAGAVALALVAQLDRMGQTFLVFAFAMLPALLALGLMSYARLADLAVHDAYYARAIGRIRSFYFEFAGPESRHYWLLSAGDDLHAVMRHAGQKHSRWHRWTHAATAVAAVTAVIGGVLVGLVVEVATPLVLPWTAVVATLVTTGAFALLLADQERRWRASDASAPAQLPPDRSPHEPNHAHDGAACPIG